MNRDMNFKFYLYKDMNENIFIKNKKNKIYKIKFGNFEKNNKTKIKIYKIKNIYIPYLIIKSNKILDDDMFYKSTNYSQNKLNKFLKNNLNSIMLKGGNEHYQANINYNNTIFHRNAIINSNLENEIFQNIIMKKKQDEYRIEVNRLKELLKNAIINSKISIPLLNKYNYLYMNSENGTHIIFSKDKIQTFTFTNRFKHLFIQKQNQVENDFNKINQYYLNVIQIIKDNFPIVYSFLLKIVTKNKNKIQMKVKFSGNEQFSRLNESIKLDIYDPRILIVFKTEDDSEQIKLLKDKFFLLYDLIDYLNKYPLNPSLKGLIKYKSTLFSMTEKKKKYLLNNKNI